MEQKEYSRRKFIQQWAGPGAALFGTVLLLNSCGSNGKPAANEENSTQSAAEPCNDFTGVSAEELDKRKRFAYTDKSEVPGNTCGNCSLYIPWKDQAECGGCLLFKGPVKAEGHCTQWAAKAE